MLEALDITAEEAEGLAELARHDLALARDFAARAQAAEDAEEATRLARSYQRAARSYRQTLALKARLKRDLSQAAAATAEVQAKTPRPRPGGAAVARRLSELRTALARLCWDEAERAETEAETADPAETAEHFAFRRLDIELELNKACARPDFCDETLDDHVARLALAFGFEPAAIARWRDLRDPPNAAPDPEPGRADWRSSA